MTVHFLSKKIKREQDKSLRMAWWLRATPFLGAARSSSCQASPQQTHAVGRECVEPSMVLAPALEESRSTACWGTLLMFKGSLAEVQHLWLLPQQRQRHQQSPVWCERALCKTQSHWHVIAKTGSLPHYTIPNLLFLPSMSHLPNFEYFSWFPTGPLQGLHAAQTLPCQTGHHIQERPEQFQWNRRMTSLLPLLLSTMKTLGGKKMQ